MHLWGICSTTVTGNPCGGDHTEIGAGPNLYPLMAAARHRDRVHVTDIAESNLRYVQSELDQGFSATWKRWHSALRAVGGGYDTDEAMVRRLCEICTFDQVSVLDLPEGCYDSCSMMFVAESITNDVAEFAAALLQSVRCVRVGGSFVVALMLNKPGYAGDATFPAVPVTRSDVETLISPEADGVGYTDIGFNVRAGHDGMLLVAGRRGLAVL